MRRATGEARHHACQPRSATQPSNLLCSLVRCARPCAEFSAHLLGTVASLIRAYPGTIYVAVGAAGVLLAWTLIWVAAVSYTSQFASQATVLALLLLSFVWVTQLLRAIINATVAGTVASWYFLSPNVPRDPTSRALRRALTTSFGSLCLGSLVAASLKTMRMAAKSVSSRVTGDGWVSHVRHLALCCLGFLDVLTRFFNELAYTQVHARSMWACGHGCGRGHMPMLACLCTHACVRGEHVSSHAWSSFTLPLPRRSPCTARPSRAPHGIRGRCLYTTRESTPSCSEN